ncbi:MAG TPA: CBS domain-containing protein [bacterium]|nr:CBS domain-containing protein [bacterium]
MRVREMMSSPVETIDLNEDAAVALRKMHENRHRHLVVVEGKRAIGLLSEYDLKNESNVAGKPVSAFMSKDFVSVDPHTKVRECANLLRGRTIGCLAVLEDEKPVGIVTISDLLELIGKGTERTVTKGQRRTIFSRGRHRKPVS